MKLRLDQNTFFQFLLDPTPRYRVARHGLLWSAMTFLIYGRFNYNAIQLSSADDRTAYVMLSTPNRLLLTNGTELPIGLSYRDSLKKYITLLP